MDIETVPRKEKFEDLSAPFQKLWEEKTVWQRKDDIDGGQAADIYYQKDALTIAQLLLSYKGEEIIKEENIEFAQLYLLKNSIFNNL